MYGMYKLFFAMRGKARSTRGRHGSAEKTRCEMYEMYELFLNGGNVRKQIISRPGSKMYQCTNFFISPQIQACGATDSNQKQWQAGKQMYEKLSPGGKRPMYECTNFFNLRACPGRAPTAASTSFPRDPNASAAKCTKM